MSETTAAAPPPPPPIPVTRKTAAKSAMWSVVENGGLALISFASLIIYSRFLSVSEFGVFSIVLAAIELMSVLVSMLFHDALVQRKDVEELHYDTAFTTVMVLSALLVAGCWFAAPIFAERVGSAIAGPALVWTSLSLPLTAISATIVARQRRELDFKLLAMRSLVGRTAGSLAGIALVLVGFGIWGLIAQQMLVVLFGSAALWITARNRPRLRFGALQFKQLIAFGGFSVAALFLSFSIKRAFVILSGVTLGPHAAGLLNLSFRAVDTFWALAATAISQIALPILASLRADDARFKRAFESASAFTCIALYFAFVLIGSTSLEIVELLFGAQWIDIAPYVTILALQVLVQARRLLVPPVLTALGKPRELLIGQSAEMLFILAAIWLSGVPSVGWAVAIWVARECLGGSILFWLLKRSTGIGIVAQLKSSMVAVAAACAMFAAVWACRTFLIGHWSPTGRALALVPLGTLVYFACAWLMDKQMLKSLVEFGRSAVSKKLNKAAKAVPEGSNA